MFEDSRFYLLQAYGIYTPEIIMRILQCEAPKIAKLVYNSNN
jgi:hypothetical protein